MPSIIGGDQLGKDYSPHMYIGDIFIWNTGESFVVDGVAYKAGYDDADTLICAEMNADNVVRMLDESEIPAEISEKIVGKTMTAHAEKVRAILEKVGEKGSIISSPSAHADKVNSL
jgi:hypothetical protein